VLWFQKEKKDAIHPRPNGRGILAAFIKAGWITPPISLASFNSSSIVLVL
jgi:hypothetical protein